MTEKQGGSKRLTLLSFIILQLEKRKYNKHGSNVRYTFMLLILKQDDRDQQGYEKNY